jgi:hypothetical protein
MPAAGERTHVNRTAMRRRSWRSLDVSPAGQTGRRVWGQRPGQPGSRSVRFAQLALPGGRCRPFRAGVVVFLCTCRRSRRERASRPGRAGFMNIYSYAISLKFGRIFICHMEFAHHVRIFSRKKNHPHSRARAFNYSQSYPHFAQASAFCERSRKTMPSGLGFSWKEASPVNAP